MALTREAACVVANIPPNRVPSGVRQKLHTERAARSTHARGWKYFLAVLPANRSYISRIIIIASSDSSGLRSVSMI